MSELTVTKLRLELSWNGPSDHTISNYSLSLFDITYSIFMLFLNMTKVKVHLLVACKHN